MNGKFQSLSANNFNQGLITRVNDVRISDNAFSDCQNIELNDRFVPTKMLGHQKYNSVTLGSNSIRGGIVYTRTDGTKYYIFVCNGKIFYSIAGSGAFTAYQIGGNDLTIDNDSDVEFVQYNNVLYVVNGKYPIITNSGYSTSRMIKIDGTTPSSLTGTDIPQGLKYIIVHQERLFGASSADQPNGVYWTESKSPEDWTPTYGLNYDFIGKDDGENITGEISYQNYVYIFKPRNIYRYSTIGDITQWTRIKVDTNLGSLYHRVIKEMEGYLYYLSAEGVVKFDGNYAVLISEQIQDRILSLPQLLTQSQPTWLQTLTSDFDTGIFDSKIIDTSSNQIKQKSINKTTNWDINRGLLSSIDGKVISPEFFEYNPERGISFVLINNILYAILGGETGTRKYFYKFDLATYEWTRLTDTITYNASGNSISKDGTTYIYHHTSYSSGPPFPFWYRIYRYTISTNSWIDLTAQKPWLTIQEDWGNMGGVFNESNNYFYTTFFIYDSVWKCYLKKLRLDYNHTATLSYLPAVYIVHPGATMHLFNNDIYITCGNYNTTFYKFSTSSETLITLTAIPNANGVYYGNSITNDGTNLYMIFGDVTGKNKFYRYNVSTNDWTQLADLPYDSYSGAAITFDGNDTIFYCCGKNPSHENNFFVYSITKNSWTPYVISETIDFSVAPTSYGNIAGNISGNIVFQSKSSTTDLSDADWELASGWSSNISNNGAIPSTLNRYLRIKVLPTITNSYNVLNETYIGSIWKSIKKDLGQTPTAWGKFESSYILNNQTITFWMRSASTEGGLDSATWYQQTPGINVSSVTLNQWIQVEVRFNTILYSEVPIVDSIKIFYSLGSNVLLSPCAVVWKNNYWLNVADNNSSYNDIVYQYSKNGYWLFKSNKKNNIYLIDEINLISGTSESDGFVRLNDTGYKEDTTNIDAWFITKNFQLSPITNLFSKIFITYLSDNNFTLYYSIDNGSYNSFTINSSTDINTILKTLPGIKSGQFIKFKIRQNLEDTNFEFHGLQLIWKPLRTINNA